MRELEEVGVGGLHLFGAFEGVADLDQFALADAGAPFGGCFPFAARFEQMGPEGEQAALGGLDGMDATAFGGKECTLACSQRGAIR